MKTSTVFQLRTIDVLKVLISVSGVVDAHQMIFDRVGDINWSRAAEGVGYPNEVRETNSIGTSYRSMIRGFDFETSGGVIRGGRRCDGGA